jgi:hypothetical protein
VAVPTFLRLNSVPNTHVTALCYRKIRSSSESGGTFARVSCPTHGHQTDLNHPAYLFPFLQTKKLRRIDCSNRYCVWSAAHPQPVNLCQPCYCDKVSYTRNLISDRRPNFTHFYQFAQPHSALNPALTQSPFFSVPRFFLFLPFLPFPSLPCPPSPL